MAPKENGLLKRIADALERLAPAAVGRQAPARGEAFVWEPLHGGLVGVAHVASLPLSLLIPGETADTIFDVSRPINGPGADIKGVEASFQHDFDFLPAPFDHLGVNLKTEDDRRMHDLLQSDGAMLDWIAVPNFLDAYK